MLINKKFNAFMDFRNLGRGIYERRAPKNLEFISGRYHVLREIYQKFDRVFSVKRISLYLKSRARLVEKHTSMIHRQHNSGRPPNYKIRTTGINSKAQNQIMRIHNNLPSLKHTSIN